jgi:hypothetical protein
MPGTDAADPAVGVAVCEGAGAGVTEGAGTAGWVGIAV